MSRKRTRVGVPVVTSVKGKRKQDAREVGEWSPLQSGGSVVQGSSSGGSAEMLTLFRNEVREQVFQNFLCYDPERKHGSYVQKKILSNAALDGWIKTAVRCMEEKRRKAPCREEEADTYESIIRTATKHLV